MFIVMVDVSVVIVCMNNLKNLYPCLDSIKEHTTVSIEVLVVAYLFSPENLAKVRKDYPWVTFIESNAIRGFSENNNLALRQAKGKYCFVLNDDTELTSDVVGQLLHKLESLPSSVAVLSPKLLFGDGSLQCCGRDDYSLFSFIKREYSIDSQKQVKSKYVNQKGLFETKNIMGAAFLIRTSVFEEIGFFDERYFFCPEDIAVSTKLRKNGYLCYVDADVFLYHYQGGTWGKMRTATMPTHLKGEQLFVADSCAFYWLLFAFLVFPIRLFKSFCWWVKYMISSDEKDWIMAVSNMNVCCVIFLQKTPKEVFLKFYNKLR